MPQKKLFPNKTKPSTSSSVGRSTPWFWNKTGDGKIDFEDVLLYLYSNQPRLVFKLIGIALIIAISFWTQFENGSISAERPFIGFLPLVIITSLLFGARFGILATLIGVTFKSYILFFPKFSNDIEFSSDFYPFVFLFIFNGLIVSISIGLIQRYVLRYKQAELELNSNQFQTIVEMAPNALIMINSDGLIELVNASAESIFGFHRDELLGQSLDILLPERMRSQHQIHRTSFFKSPEHRSMGAGRELFALHKNGSEFPVEIGLNPIHFNGQIHVVAAIVDITERKALERTILKTNERFTMAANAAGMGFWSWNIQTNTLNWDEWMFKLYGSEMEQKEQAYTVWRNHLHPEDKERAEQELMGAVANIKPFDTEFRIIKTSGEICYIKAFAHILRAADGSPIEMFGLNMDITGRMLAEQNQQRLVNDLKEINEELNNFTYVASHDLKSPLRGIDQLSKWITEDIGDQLDPSTNEHLRLMRSRIKRMESLLDDLLTYSRVGRSKDVSVQVDTKSLVIEIFELVSLNLPINLKCITFMPIIQTPKVPLELVFRNLISNAIKHNSNKADLCIEIGATPLENGYEFYVRDNGAGIPPEHHERVFGMFQKLKSRDEVEGSGIGLAIVKKIVESYEGNVEIISDGINGCEFHFSWPLNLKKNPL